MTEKEKLREALERLEQDARSYYDAVPARRGNPFVRISFDVDLLRAHLDSLPTEANPEAEAIFDFEEATGSCGNPYCTENGCPDDHPLGYPSAIMIEGMTFLVHETGDTPSPADGMDEMRALHKHAATIRAAIRAASGPDAETRRKAWEAMDRVASWIPRVWDGGDFDVADPDDIAAVNAIRAGLYPEDAP